MIFKIKTKNPVRAYSLFITIFLIFCLTANVTYSQDSSSQNIAADQVGESELKQEVINSFGKGRRNNPKYAIERGMLRTGLTPKFDKRFKCRGIDDYWAMDYSHKRGREAYHGGIDIPAPKGTPVLAVADGIVVAKFMNKENPKGIEIMLRHSPLDTGHNMWIYTQYTHLLEMPTLEIGQRVQMGEVIGKTSNSGLSGAEARRRYGSGESSQRKGGSRSRRHALHLGVIYSNSQKYMKNETILIPVDAYWMDPNALYRKSPPFDSPSLKMLPKSQKQVSIPFMLPSGETVPTDTKVIWPYTCSEK